MLLCSGSIISVPFISSVMHASNLQLNYAVGTTGKYLNAGLT